MFGMPWTIGVGLTLIAYLASIVVRRWQHRRWRDQHNAMRVKLGRAVRQQLDGDFAGSEAEILALLSEFRRRRPGDIEILLRAAQFLALARILRGRLAEAEADLTALLDEYGPHNQPNQSAAWQAAGQLAVVYGHRGRYEDALALATRVADALAHRRGPESGLALLARHRVGWCLFKAGRTEAALAMLTEVTAAFQRMNGLSFGRNTLAEVQLRLGLLDEAEAGFRAALAEEGPTSGGVAQKLSLRFALAKIAARRGQPEADEFAEVLDRMHTMLGEDAPWVLEIRYELAELGEPVDARKAHQAVLTDRIRVLGPDHPDTAISREAVTRHE